VGCDIGGFWRDCEPELFVRWIEVGTFYPFFRNHSAKNTKNQEPWKFNKDVEDIARKYINLRYQLIPYIYSLFYEAKEKGIPILRSLILEFPDDPKVIEFEDEFMFGPCFLIAPIYEKGKIERKVYLPRGKWYNFWNNEIFEGPKIIKVKAQLDTIPIFVREGSIIPMWEVKNYIGEKIDKIYLKIYPGDGEFLYYEDDGISWGYERGEYNLIKFSLYNNKLNKEYIHNGYKGVDNFCLF
jgi:alpha-glucosidase